MIPAPLRAAYRETEYRIATLDHPIAIRIDMASPALDILLSARGVDRGAIVTAWNPRSRQLDPAENHRRGEALAAEIRRSGRESLPAAAIAKDPAWNEDGFLILGIDAEEAAALGRSFDQNAIVLVRHAEPACLLDLTDP